MNQRNEEKKRIKTPLQKKESKKSPPKHPEKEDPQFGAKLKKFKSLKEKSGKAFKNFSLSSVPEDIRKGTTYFDPDKDKDINEIQMQVLFSGLEKMNERISKIRIPIIVNEEEKQDWQVIKVNSVSEKKKKQPVKIEIPGKVIINHFAKNMFFNAGVVNSESNMGKKKEIFNKIDEIFEKKIKHMRDANANK